MLPEISRPVSVLSDMRRRRADYYYREAARLARLGAHDQALAAYNRVIDLAPGSAEAHYLRAFELSHLGRHADALADFDQVTALMPGETDAAYHRGSQLSRLGRHTEAFAAYDRAVAGASDPTFFRTRKGVALAGVGDFDSALTEFDAAYRAAPEKAGEAEAWAGAILWHRGKDQDARKRFARVKGRVSGNTAFGAAELEAIARCALGDPNGAEQALRAAKSRQGPVHQDTLAPLYELLAAPPLAGVDQLRVIATADR